MMRQNRFIKARDLAAMAVLAVVASGCALPFAGRSTVENDWSCRVAPSGPCRSMETIDREISSANPSEGGTLPAGGGGYEPRNFQQVQRSGSVRSGERTLAVRVEGYADRQGVYHEPAVLRVIVTDPEWVDPSTLVGARADGDQIPATEPRLSERGTRLPSGEVRLPSVDGGATQDPQPRRVSWFGRLFARGDR